MATYIKYNHLAIESFDSASPKVISQIICNLFNPKSLVDVGCGVGNWLHAFKDRGVTDLMGIDGHHLKTDLFKLELNELMITDLEKPFLLNRRFDVALCLEVAEHLSIETAYDFIQSLCKLSDTIIFSAAAPHQGGQNHLNEKPVSYWAEKFSNFGYKYYDFIRPLIWNEPEVKSWYKQNIFVASKKQMDITPNSKFEIMDIIHPELFYSKQVEILEGKQGVKIGFQCFINSLKEKYLLSR